MLLRSRLDASSAVGRVDTMFNTEYECYLHFVAKPSPNPRENQLVMQV